MVRSIVLASSFFMQMINPSFAEQLIGTQTLKISAELVTPNCSLEFPLGYSTDFGTMHPKQISFAPSDTNSNALSYIRKLSAFGSISDKYKQGIVPIKLKISCLSSGDFELSNFSKYYISFGDISQILQGDIPGAASNGYVYKLNYGGDNTKRSLGIVLYVNDSLASNMGGVDGLARPGKEYNFIDEYSFAKNASGNAYEALFNISPGLFWAKETPISEGGSFSTEITVTLGFN